MGAVAWLIEAPQLFCLKIKKIALFLPFLLNH